MTDVLYAVDGPVATITLNRPDRLNAIVPGMGEEYAAALLRADADPVVRAIVVTGSSPVQVGHLAFGAGCELHELSTGMRDLERVFLELTGEQS